MMLIWNPGTTLDSVEEQVIKAAMDFYKDEKTAADSLKLTIQQFTQKLKKHQKEWAKAEELKEYERQKQEEYMLRARGKSQVA